MSLEPPDPVFVLRGGMETIACLAFGSKDVIYAGAQDGVVHVWDLAINRRRCSFTAGDSTCLSINVLGGNILTQLKGGQLIIWQVCGDEYVKQRELNISYQGFCKVELCIGVTNSFLCVPAENACISLVNLEQFKIEKSLSNSSFQLGEVMVVRHCVMLSHSLIFAGYESGHIILWDSKLCEVLNHVKLDGTPMAIDFDPVKRMGLCGTESEKVFVFHLMENNSISEYKVLTLTNPGVSSIRIRKDQKLFVLGCWDGYIRIFSWKSLRLLCVITEHKETVHDLCFSCEEVPTWKSKYLLAVASKDKSISLWSIYEN